ncbi:hypothetical protein SO802_004707 [Lithocarpus litseifolius]|uniref:Uncharacterized protein n=1 Tax=Lithocarpus litseifolius TaxID=425828 RepID=A0AAW2E7C5_9ROSI
MEELGKDRFSLATAFDMHSLHYKHHQRSKAKSNYPPPRRHKPGFYAPCPLPMEGFWIFDLPKPGSVCMLMYHIVIGKKDRLVNGPTWFLGALRPLYLPIEQKAFAFCVPRDRWDREFFKLQGG